MLLLELTRNWSCYMSLIIITATEKQNIKCLCSGNIDKKFKRKPVACNLFNGVEIVFVCAANSNCNWRSYVDNNSPE